MIARKSVGDRFFDFLNALFMICMIVITVYPFLYVIFASVSESRLLVGHSGLLLFPKGFSLSAYQLVLRNPNIATGYQNTLFIIVLGTFLNLLLTSFGAYVLSRKNFKFKNIMMILIVFTMYFSGGMIPDYILMKNLNLLDSVWCLILPAMLSAYNMIILKTFFSNLPSSLEESAYLDGASHLVILIRIVLPLSTPVLATLSLFYAVWRWNAFNDALFYISSSELFPMQLKLYQLVFNNMALEISEQEGGGKSQLLSESLKAASIVFTTVPILLVYPWLQRYFISGIMIGAVKG
mgnify:CR=1 FL=1